MLIDTHCHVNFKTYNLDSNEVIKRALDESVWMLLVGSGYKTSNKAIELANKFQKGVYASVGVHPIHLQKDRAGEEGYETTKAGESFNYDMYAQLAAFEKVVAIGEIGLDYYHLGFDDVQETKKKQKELLISQLDLALDFDLPIVVHCRQAHDDLLALLQEYRKENKNSFPADKCWGVMHCFSGNEDLAWEYFNLGLLISFTGLITFSKQWDDLIRKVPLDKLLVETDSPYMTPEPFRGQRNEPVLVKFVAQRIADIKGVGFQRVAEATTRNAKRLFSI